MSYVPSTPSQRTEMLSALDCSSAKELFRGLPAEVLLEELNLPEGLSELEVSRRMEQLAGENRVYSTIFRGAGAYDHYIPAIVKSVTSKEEFLTAYTPYQAEISQGILQSIFEYQTMICELTGMDSSNASVYDGATAAAEAIAMTKERKRVRAFVSATTPPQVLAVMRTYCAGSDTELTVVPERDGRTDAAALASLLGEDSACFYLQQPNYYGVLEDAAGLGEIVHAAGAKFIMGCNPIPLAILQTPAEAGADIAVGEGQPLGLPLSFGGPYLGFMACRQALTRKLPGRIVGETTDSEGNRAFVLTLQAREQHIRREKASSNICSNEALCAMTAAVYLAAMGPEGLQNCARQCRAKAHYLAARLSELPGFTLCHEAEFFHEFVMTCPIPASRLLAALEREGILGGLPLDEGRILWCATEKNTRADIDRLVELIREEASR